MSYPEPPTNVRVRLFDGTRIPVDTIYKGVDQDGCHVWESVRAFDRNDVSGVEVDKLPAKTSVAIDLGPAS